MNGWYSSATNEIHININGDYTVFQTAAHELTHFIRVNNPDGYEALKDYLLKKYENVEDGEAVNILVRKQQEKAQNSKNHPRKLTYDQALEEVVANACQNMLKDTQAIQQLAKENKSLAKSIKTWIDNFVKAIKKAFTGLTKNSIEYKWLSSVVDDMTELQELWDDALVGAANKIQTMKSGDLIYSEVDSFKKQVEDSLNNQLNKRNALYVSDTSDILIKAGLKQLPMLYTQSHLKNALMEKSKANSRFHGLSKEQILKMPEIIESPTIIMDSLSRNDSIVLVSNELDNDGFPIIMSVIPNGTGVYELVPQESNFITSYYGRNNDFNGFINNAIENDKVIYVNKIKSQNLYQQIGLQLPNGFNKLGFDNIVHQSRNIVNSSIRENSENDTSKHSELQDTYSPRELLASALDTVAQNDSETKALGQYKSKINEINDLDTRLGEIGSQLKDLYFAKGTKDIEQIRTLETERDSIRKKINLADKKLLDLQATKPLKDLYNRQLKASVKEEYKKGKQELKEYKKERAATADKRKYIAGIESTAKELSDWIVNPKLGKSVPKQMEELVIDFINSIDYERGNLNKYGETTAHDKQWQYNALLLANKMTNPSQDFDFEFPKALLENFKEFLSVPEVKNARVIYDLDTDSLKILYTVMKTLKKTISSVNKFIAGNQKMTVSQAAKEDIKSWETVSKRKGGNTYTKLNNTFYWNAMNSFTYFNTLGGNAEKLVFQQIVDGQNKMYSLCKEAQEYLDSIADMFKIPPYKLLEFDDVK